MIYREDLLGSWHLLSWALTYPNSSRVELPFGKSPVGLLIYSSDGWMSAAISRSERPPLDDSSSPRDLPAGVLADAWQSYFHYAGRYRIEDNSVIHSVSQCLYPNMVGSEQVRTIEISGNTLTLSGTELIRGGERHHRLIWQRHKPLRGV